MDAEINVKPLIPILTGPSTKIIFLVARYYENYDKKSYFSEAFINLDGGVVYKLLSTLKIRVNLCM